MENNNVVKKKNVGLRVLVFILIAVVLGLAGYIVYDKYDISISKKDNKDTKETENTSKKEETKKEEKSILKDKDKEIVYTLGDYKYKKVPYINIDTEDAEKLNKKITNFVDKNGNDTDYGEYKALDYVYYTNDDVLSVVVFVKYPTPDRYYETVNINTKTGEIVSNDDLLKLKKIDSTELSQKVFNVYENKAGGVEKEKKMRVDYDDYT